MVAWGSKQRVGASSPGEHHRGKEGIEGRADIHLGVPAGWQREGNISGESIGGASFICLTVDRELKGAMTERACSDIHAKNST